MMHNLSVVSAWVKGSADCLHPRYVARSALTSSDKRGGFMKRIYEQKTCQCTFLRQLAALIALVWLAIPARAQSIPQTPLFPTNFKGEDCDAPVAATSSEILAAWLLR